MNIGAFVEDGPTGPYMGLLLAEGPLLVKINLADDEHRLEVINGLVKGLKEAGADLHRRAIGLEVAGRPATSILNMNLTDLSDIMKGGNNAKGT